METSKVWSSQIVFQFGGGICLPSMDTYNLKYPSFLPPQFLVNTHSCRASFYGESYTVDCSRSSTYALFFTTIAFFSLCQYTSLKSRARGVPHQLQQVLVHVQNNVPGLQHCILIRTPSRTRPYLKSGISRRWLSKQRKICFPLPSIFIKIFYQMFPIFLIGICIFVLYKYQFLRLPRDSTCSMYRDNLP